MVVPRSVLVTFSCTFIYHLLQKHKLIFLNTDSIQSIRKGLDFGRQLELPDKVSFGSECMAQILGTESFVRPFHQIRYVD